jgi:tagaturonate reductase
MKPLNRTTAPSARKYPVRVVQFGEGNFLRAFVDWMIFQMNEKCDFNTGIAIVQPIEKGLSDTLNKQDGLYH